MATLFKTTAQFDKTNNGFVITIPSRRNYIALVLMIPFILCWSFAELIILPRIFIHNVQAFASSLGVFWLAGWTFIGLYLIKLCLWKAIGKTILIFENNILTIQRKWDLFYKSKNFDLSLIKNVHVVNKDLETNGYYTRPNYLFTSQTKSIVFDYNNKSIQIVDWATAEDVKKILQRLEDENILTGKNYA